MGVCTLEVQYSTCVLISLGSNVKKFDFSLHYKNVDIQMKFFQHFLHFRLSILGLFSSYMY